jgi:hypothetical protein
LVGFSTFLAERGKIPQKNLELRKKNRILRGLEKGGLGVKWLFFNFFKGA